MNEEIHQLRANKCPTETQAQTLRRSVSAILLEAVHLWLSTLCAAELSVWASPLAWVQRRWHLAAQQLSVQGAACSVSLLLVELVAQRRFWWH